MRKKRKIDLDSALRKIKQASLDSKSAINAKENVNELGSIKERADALLKIINDPKRPIGNMLFFIMYDIESNKVRTQIAKYLLKKGCTRIQKSIFLADLSSGTFDDIKKDLSAVQSMYENNDSILIVPISINYLEAMKIIGQNIDIDIITNNANTIFF